MKKLLCLLLCALMCVTVALGMSACGDKSDVDTGSNQSESPKKTAEELIIGKWVCDFKFTKDFFNQILDDEEAGMEEMLEYFDLSKLSLKIAMEFKNDGTAKAGVADKDAEAFVDAYIEVMGDGMIKTMEDIAEEAGMTFDDYLEQMGMTEKEFIDSFKQEIDTNEIKNQFIDGVVGESGYYQIKDGKLYTSDDKTFEEDEAEEFEVTEDTLKLKMEGIEVVFTRQK